MSALEARIVRRIGGLDLDVSMRIEPGQTVALLGPNGAGKSTTVGALSGADFDGATSGTEIVLGTRTLEGVDGFVRPERRRIGVVFQDALLLEHLSVVDNIAFPVRCSGASKRASRSTAHSWLERLGMSAVAERRPADLSGGEAQRVAIARALAAEPEMLLLDEPLSALDVSSRSEVRRMLRTHLDAFGGPRLLVTHDPSDAFLLADRLDVLEAGRITQSGSPDDIRRAPATPYVAALAGTNMFTGRAEAGSVLMVHHDHTLTIADTTLQGDVLVTVHPTAISLHPERPSGSQRNVWQTTVDLIEPLGDTVRVTLATPMPVAVDGTPGAIASLRLTEGATVWAAVKATEINAVEA
ncbi:MAG: ATP-binding cassette domain-containing protein [Ilumatobacter sp.]